MKLYDSVKNLVTRLRGQDGGTVVLPDGTSYYRSPSSPWRLRIVVTAAVLVLAAGTVVGIRLVGHHGTPSAPPNQTTSSGQQSTNAAGQSSSTTNSNSSKTKSKKSSSKSSTKSSSSSSNSSSNTSSSGSGSSSGSSGNSGGSSGGSGGSSGSGGTSSEEHVITTLYAYPTESSWSQVESSAPTVKYAIVNICAPDGTGSGCGSPADEINPDWTPTIKALNDAGITPLYYISTNYGAIALSTLESEIQNAITWYGTPSPMFDTVSTTATCSNDGNPIACTTYYKDLYTYAVDNGASAVMYNPGTIPPSSYMSFGSKEIVQVYEGTASGFETASFPSWMSGYPASEFAATLSDGTSSTVGEDVTDALKDNIGNIYEDDEAEPPNYSTLPSFWSAEVTDAKNTN